MGALSSSVSRVGFLLLFFSSFFFNFCLFSDIPTPIMMESTGNNAVLSKFRIGFSSAFNIVGLILVGMALLLKTPVEISNALDLIGEESSAKLMIWMSLVAGCLSLIAALVTLSIPPINSRPLLVLYAVALFSMVLLQLVTGAYVLYRRATIRQTLRNEFDKLPQVNFKSGNDRQYQVLRALQIKFKCCGFTHGCLDWKSSSSDSKKIHISPGCSCRPDEAEVNCRFYGELNDAETTCHDNTNDGKSLPLRTTTCHDRIASHVEERSTLFASVLLVFSLAQLSALMAAALTISNFHRTSSDLNSPPGDDVITDNDVMTARDDDVTEER